MPARRPLLPCSVALALAACAGVSPRPGAVLAAELPTVELTAAQRERLAALTEEGVRTIVMRRYAEAERAAAEALALDPRCARARAVRSMVLLQAANAEDPVDLFLANEGEAEVRLAIELAPADPFVGWVHALFLAERGHLSAAAAAAEAALARTEEAPSAERAPLYGLAGTYRYELGEERAALPHLEAYVDLRPDDATASFRMGSCLLRMAMVLGSNPDTREKDGQRQAEWAARAFRRCAELAPGDEDAALAVGAALMRAAELAGERGLAEERARLLQEAREQFQDVALRFPDSAEARFRVGVVEEERGDPPAARIAYAAGLERDAGHLGCLLNLAALRAAEPDGDSQAAELLRRALEVDREASGLSSGERRRIEEFLTGR